MHTSGPWLVTISAFDAAEDGITAGLGKICICTRPTNAEDRAWYANARVIAAAPDMLDAIRDLLVIAEQNITDLAAEAQEGAPVAKMEMARWGAVLNAYAKAMGDTRRRE